MPEQAIQVPIEYTAETHGAIQGAGRVDEALEQVEKSAKQAEKAYAKLEQAGTRAAKSTARAFNAQAKATRTGGDLGKIGQSTGYFGAFAGDAGLAGLGGNLNLASGLFDVGEGLKNIREEAPAAVRGLAATVGGFASLAAAAVVGAGVGLAFIGLNKILSDSKKRVEEATKAMQDDINTRREMALFLAQASTEEIQAKLDAARSRQAFDLEEKARLDTLIKDYEAQRETGALGIAAPEPFESLIGGVPPGATAETLKPAEFTAAKTALDELNAGLGKTEKEINAYNTALEANAGQLDVTSKAQQAATASIEASEQRLTAIRVAALNQRTQADEDAAKRAISWTEEQAAARQEEIDIEQTSLAKRREELLKMAATGQDVNDELNSLNTAWRALALEEEALVETALPLIQLRAQEAEKVEAAKTAYEDSKKAAEDAAEQLERAATAQRDYAAESISIERKRQTAILEEQADYERQRLRDLAAHYQDLADLDGDYFEDRADLLEELAADDADANQERLDILRDFNRDDVRALEDHKDRLAEIANRGDQDIENAAMRLDAVGVRRAQQAAAKELDTEAKTYRKEKERRDQNYRDQVMAWDRERQARLRDGQKRLAELTQQYAEERNRRLADFSRRLAEEDADRQIRLQRQRQQWATEDAERLAAYTRELNNLVGHNGRMYTTAQQGYAALEQALKTSLQNMAAAAAAVNASTGINPTPPSIPVIPGFAGGGVLADRQTAMVGEREPEFLTRMGNRFIVTPMGRGRGGGVNVTIPVNVGPGGDANFAQKLNAHKGELQSLVYDFIVEMNEGD